MNVVAYTSGDAARWDAAVRASRNGTFLLERGYMDYHSDRFSDASLLFVADDGAVRGLLPANSDVASQTICAHGGLTYGGLILSPEASLDEVREMLSGAADYYLAHGYRQLLTKPVPAIYHRYPADEERYWLFRAGAHCEACGASSAILLEGTQRAALWHRKMKVKACAALTLHEGGVGRLLRFWPIVNAVLTTRHGTHPVHTAAEMALLMARFPEQIRLFTVDNEAGEVITGALLFVTDKVVHVQYMEAGEEARRRRALDWLIRRLIDRFAAEGFKYFDFGISTERGGTYLNNGLAYQKEGFGGRCVCYEAYRVDFEKLAALKNISPA